MSTETARVRRDTTTTMRAVTQSRYGTSDVLSLTTIERPIAGAGEVLFAVRAAGLDRGTEHLMTGKPYAIRLGTGLRHPENPIPGRDVAGIVTAIGDGVTRFSDGDEVYGVARGSFAEYAVTTEGKLAAKPTNLSFAQAAVVPISGATALQALTVVGNIQAGQSVLVTGASGGVGGYAVQIARILGAQVTGVCSTSKADHVTGLGAHHVIDYTSTDWADGTHRYDLILDIAGNPSLRHLRRALHPRGTAVFIGGESAGGLTGMGRQFRGAALSLFIKQQLRVLLARERAIDYEHLSNLIQDSQVVPSLDRTYPLEQAPDAMRQLERGDVRGKVAITI